MNIRVLMPSRERPQKLKDAIAVWLGTVSGRHDVRLCVAADADDHGTAQLGPMLPPEVTLSFRDPTATGGKVAAYFKAQQMAPWSDHLGDDFGDITIVASDDLAPAVRGWDSVVADLMLEQWPGLDGALWIPAQPQPLMTMPIIGRGLYPWFNDGFYDAAYLSEWCDSELHEVLARRGKLIKITPPSPMFEHSHPALKNAPRDDLYRRNMAQGAREKATFDVRRDSGFGWPDRPLLSLLIPTMPHRGQIRRRLIRRLERMMEGLGQQIARHVETVWLESDGSTPTGAVRNDLLARATGEYVAFIDDDDELDHVYLWHIVNALISTDDPPDAIGFRVLHRLHGQDANVYTISGEFKEWKGLQRSPNHLTPMRREIARSVGFPAERWHGEDAEFSARLVADRHIARCVDLPNVLYIYDDRRLRGTPRADLPLAPVLRDCTPTVERQRFPGRVLKLAK